MSNILVFGKGYIGSTIAAYLSCHSSDDLLYSYDDIQHQIDQYKPKIIINCLGMTGKTVDDCEKDKTEALKAFTFNPLLLAEAAIRNNLKLVHISSGSIYKTNEGSDTYSEDETPNFHDQFYSRAKIYTEYALGSLAEAANILILRVMHPLSYVPHPRNILTRLLSMPKIIDTPVSITYLPDFLLALKHLIKKDAEGIYNVVNYGSIRYTELLEEYRKLDHNFNYAVMAPEDLKEVRTHAVLSTDKLEEAGFPVRDIHDVLKECMEKYYENLKDKQNARYTIDSDSSWTDTDS